MIFQIRFQGWNDLFNVKILQKRGYITHQSFCGFSFQCNQKGSRINKLLKRTRILVMHTLNRFKEFSWSTGHCPFPLHLSFLVHTVPKAVRGADAMIVLSVQWGNLGLAICFGPTYLNMRSFSTLLGSFVFSSVFLSQLLWIQL